VTEIRGKVAFVTGGGSGIGRALAMALAAEGAAVAVADILPDNARGVVDEIEATGGRAVPIVCDVSDRAAVRQAKGEANTALGPVSLLFANAGATSFQPLTEMTDDDIDWIIGANLMGVVNCLTAFLPDMIAARDGHVFATSSLAGLCAGWIPYHSAYSAAKMGVLGLILNLRLELAELGVGASVLVPGGVATNMGKNNARYRPDRFGGPGEGPVETPDVVKELFADVGLVFRPAEDVAQMVVLAVRENRPIVVTTAADRHVFQETYVDPVMTAFDEVEAFERSLAAHAKETT
jgi:NAD(P)-dependent dehydrogenase (short-subunit alcohol dehydrogenase family)